MNLRAKRTFVELLSGQSLLRLWINAAFIAAVSFGAVGGVLTAVAPRFFFGLTESIVCPRGSAILYEEYYDGEANQVRVHCVNAASGEGYERTLAGLGVILGSFFLAFFYVALGIQLIVRAVVKAKMKT